MKTEGEENEEEIKMGTKWLRSRILFRWERNKIKIITLCQQKSVNTSPKGISGTLAFPKGCVKMHFDRRVLKLF